MPLAVPYQQTSQQQAYYQQQGGQHSSGPPTPTGFYQQSPVPTAPSGMFTRNLIGSLSASAFRLTDPDNKMGVWFILQDLSVRTEGTFRWAIHLRDTTPSDDD